MQSAGQLVAVSSGPQMPSLQTSFNGTDRPFDPQRKVGPEGHGVHRAIVIRLERGAAYGSERRYDGVDVRVIPTLKLFQYIGRGACKAASESGLAHHDRVARPLGRDESYRLVIAACRIGVDGSTRRLALLHHRDIGPELLARDLRYRTSRLRPDSDRINQLPVASRHSALTGPSSASGLRALQNAH